MSSGNWEIPVLVVSLTAGMVALSQIGDFDDLMCTISLFVAIAFTYFSSLVVVLFRHRLPAFVADNIMRASGFALAVVLPLLWCFLTAGRARPAE